MGKRILIFVLLFAVILAVVIFASAAIFSGQFSRMEDTISAEPESTPEFGEIEAAIPEPEPEVTTAPEAEPTAQPTEAETPGSETAEAAPATAEDILAGMTLEEKLCQMMFVTPEALAGKSPVTQSDMAIMEGLQKWPVGGVIYFSDNLISQEQTISMISSIQDFSQEVSGRKLFIGVDEEGGTVARAGDKLGTTVYEDMAVYGETGDTAKAYEIGSTLAADLKGLGFNVDFAPVADVLTNEENTVVSRRSFGSDPEVVSGMVSELVRGLTEGGMLCSPKHFPGHGSTGGDTHDGFAATSVTREELDSIHLKPFAAALEAGAPMVMVGHMTLTEIDPDYPASLSETIITGILRQEMGFDGIILTDAMNMGAIADNYTSAEAAVLTVKAGCDMLLCPVSIESSLTALTEAVESGEITEERINESVLRILNAKIQYGIIE